MPERRPFAFVDVPVIMYSYVCSANIGVQKMKILPVKRYGVQPGKPIRLADYDPDARAGLANKSKARALLAEMHHELQTLQQVLYADARQSLLVVMQAMDTAGKDSTIRHVFGPLNPQGVSVTSFKAPSAEELAHDFLWRVHPHCPAHGMISVFNRSHYEDVLIVKVREWASAKTITKRYEHIRAFESLLKDRGTTIVKIYLNISKDEQKQRLQDRLERPDKRWKFNPDDVKERALWPKYMKAYESALRKTSTPDAPWYIVPGNTKWARDVIIASILIRTLRNMKCEFPKSTGALSDIVIPD